MDDRIEFKERPDTNNLNQCYFSYKEEKDNDSIHKDRQNSDRRSPASLVGSAMTDNGD